MDDGENQWSEIENKINEEWIRLKKLTALIKST